MNRGKSLLCGLVAICCAFVFSADVSAHSGFKKQLQAKYPDMKVSCNVCHVDKEKKTVRNRILAGEARIDGRDPSTVRPITVNVGVLPRAHGSAVFTRGETQAIVVTTLGTGRDAQIIDALEGERKIPSCCTITFLRTALVKQGL